MEGPLIPTDESSDRCLPLASPPPCGEGQGGGGEAGCDVSDSKTCFPSLTLPSPTLPSRGRELYASVGITHIRQIIEQNGTLTVADYMELALQHPAYGYYRQHDPLGRDGDFITAPEISQMFGEMIGLWCADLWRQMGKPKNFVLLELGPGRGTLMQDALRATAKISGFHEAMILCFMESNETLRDLQRKKCQTHNPLYISNLDSEIPPLPLIVIANEFFDALPIRQFEKTALGWCERLVTVNVEELVFTLSPPDPAFLLLIPTALHEADTGAVYELSLPSLAVMNQLSQHVAQYGGAALVVDYGFTIPSGKPSLQAVSGHSYVDVLKRPGEVDLTAHVNFGLLKQVALKQGLSVSEIIGQGDFLKGLGIETRAAQLKHKATPEQVIALDSALHRLTDPSQMGGLFKVMAATSPSFSSLAGF